jgi:D-amino-acid dehydrogenase
MKVLVLGSGLLGVVTAYELGKRGYDVTVIDRNAECARETSFANGGQLSYTHAEPWASPGVLKKLPKWLLHGDSPLVIKPRADLQMIKWIARFLRNCTTHRASFNCVNILRLGLYSKDAMAEIQNETNLAFNQYSKGILHIFSNDHELEHAKQQYEFQAKFGGESRILTRAQCLELEPNLIHTSRTIVGGLHAQQDEIGDTYMFCRALESIATERYGVKFQYGVTVKKLHASGNTLTHVTTDQGDISADGYVMALGPYSPIFLKKVDIHVPIYPMKGYSITMAANEFCPQSSITDGSLKIVYTRMGDKLRVAGTAEFAGYNTSINPKRITPMVHATKEMFPKANWDQTIEEWACLRPSTPDGPPILGRTPLANLFLNTGHGTLGWTQAAGSAKIVADSMEGKPPSVLINGYTLERFS